MHVQRDTASPPLGRVILSYVAAAPNLSATLLRMCIILLHYTINSAVYTISQSVEHIKKLVWQ